MNANNANDRKSTLVYVLTAAILLAASAASDAVSPKIKEVNSNNAAVATPPMAPPDLSFSSNRFKWHGAPRAIWTERWWRWAMSIPWNVSPWMDADGTQCGINQSGDVWFLGGPLGQNFTRSCTIPVGQAILSPIVDFLNDYPCPPPSDDNAPSFEPDPGQTLEAFLIDGSADHSDVYPGVKSIIDGFTVHTAELDGKPLPVLRIATGLLSFTAASDLVTNDTCVTGSPQLGVSDGYFVFIEPLPVGEHKLRIQSKHPGWGLVSDGTYILTIKK
jgi:hypothetical protein